MKPLILLLLAAVFAEDLPPSCDKPVYCDSQLLKDIQLAGIYKDSKTFVDFALRQNEETTLNDYQELLNETNNNPTKEQLVDFIHKHFDNTSELENWTPPDYTENPAYLAKISDPALKKYATDLNAVWPTLGRKVKSNVFETPELFSFIPVSHGFIIPGGRFSELYYWDTYWIVKGLLISGMTETVKGVIENLIQLLNKIGHIPNGSRWYYQQRSQPPLLSAMMLIYFEETNDIEFIRDNIDLLEKEMKYWLDTQVVSFQKDGQMYTLLHYHAPSSGPRPESYAEDYKNAQSFQSRDNQNDFYIQIKSAAESGWDFSTRWYKNGTLNSANLTNIKTGDIVPVDLNAIIANAFENVAYFNALLKNPRRSAHWGFLAKQWRNNIEKVLWNEEDGIWYDYDIAVGAPRREFYPSNFAPLWLGAVEKHAIAQHAPRVVQYLKSSGALDYPGGIPSSLEHSGEQWDFPNAWPPLISIIVAGLEELETKDAKTLAFQIAQNWVRVCHKGFTESGQMFEKYDAENPGRFGGGGEYTVQEGFGWSNGVVIEFFGLYGERLTSSEDTNSNETS